MAVCCSLPLLLGVGIAVGAAGLVLGSGLVVALGVAAAVWGWRRRQTADHGGAPVPEDPVTHEHDRSVR